MIYRKGQKYIAMKDGKVFEEAVSSLTKVQVTEIISYLTTHEGTTKIAENGEDWIFEFDPFPERLIRYLYSNKQKLQLRYCYRGGHISFGVGRLDENDELIKRVDLKTRQTLYNMCMPEVKHIENNILYLAVRSSPKNNREGLYPIGVVVTPDDLRRGTITLPGISQFHNTRTRTFDIAPIGKLVLVWNPDQIYTYTKDGTEYWAGGESPMMESLTVIGKTRNDIKKFGSVKNAPWKALPNGINAYGTRTKIQEITIKRNDLYDSAYGAQIKMYLDNKGEDGCVMARNALGTYTANAVQFKIRSTWYCEVRIKSNSMGWDFQVNRPPIEPSSGSGASSYTTPVIALNSDVDDLEFIIIEK